MKITNRISYAVVMVGLLCGFNAHGQTLTPNQSLTVSRTLRVAGATDADATNINKAAISVNYLDGLGRSAQVVGYGQTPDQKDLVQETILYDIYNRPYKTFLPAPTGALSGGKVSTATVQSNGAAAYGFSSPDNTPFQETTQYDNSPLDRPRQAFGAGQAWRTANKPVAYFDEIAGANEVRRYILNLTGIVRSGFYPEHSLTKTRQVDEQGHTTITFNDRRGRMVEKRQQDDAGFMVTHYVYDRLDRLRGVVQPQGYEQNVDFPFSGTAFSNFVFAYEYDNQNRLVRKHIPGGGWTSYVYDKAYRPVMEQTALQAQNNRWSFTKYDLFGRVVIQGELVTANDRNTMQNLFNGIIKPYETWNGSSYTTQSYPISYNPVDERIINYYDNYDWRPTALAYNTTGAYNSAAQYADTKGLLTGMFLRSTENTAQGFRVVMYYDNKGRVTQQYATHHKGGANLNNNPIRTDYEYNFAGEVTKEKVSYKVDGLADTETVTTNEYDHVGRVVKVFHSINGAVTQELCRYTYDEIGRMIQKKILPNGTFQYSGVLDYITRTENPNTNIDDIAKKAICILPNTEISSTYTATIDPNASGGSPISGLQTMDYAYHIRGGLLGINLDAANNLATNSGQGDLFSYKLDYETAGFYDGNIGKQGWRSDTEAGRDYTYTYDPAKRLKSATYTGTGNEDYSLPQITYDKNGNITLLQRKGENNGSYQLIDNLTYAYQGNRLAGVVDAITGNTDVGDFRDNGSFNDYTYHPDGSLKSDANKGISLIEYDTFLKKVKQVNWTDGRWLKFFYDGSGTLLKRENSLGDTWEYVGGMIFKNGQFYQLSTPDGRAVYNGSNWEYEFEYRDHQNNLRVAFKAESGQLVKKQTSTQDPWGLEIQGLSSIMGVSPQNFRFQNQEKINDFSLNWNFYKYRFADAQLGRFFQTDPLAEEYVHNSTFAFSENKVISHIELEGLEAVKPDFSIPQIETNNESDKSTVNYQLNGYAGAVFGQEVKVLGVGFGVTVNAGALKLSTTDGGSNIESSAGLSFSYLGFGYSYEGREDLLNVADGQRQFTDEQEFSVPFFTYKKIKKSTTDENLDVVTQSDESEIILGVSRAKYFMGLGGSGEVGVRVSGPSGGKPKTNVLEDMVSKPDNTSTNTKYKIVEDDVN